MGGESGRFHASTEEQVAGWEPVVVHEQQPGQRRDHLILLLHGLGGHRYGTWCDLPPFLFDDLQHADIGLHTYRSGLSGLLPRRGARLTDHAREIAGIIRTDTYSRVVIVGHSMGGLLAKAVVQELLRIRFHDDGDGVSRVRGLLLIATPQAGSLRVPRLARLTRNGRALRAHSELTRDLHRTFENEVATSARTASGNAGLVYVPVHGLIGLRDAWVDELSSTLAIPPAQVLHVGCTHKDIVKPKSKQSREYRYIRDTVATLLTEERAPSIEVGSQAMERAREPAVAFGPYRRLTVDVFPDSHRRVTAEASDEDGLMGMMPLVRTFTDRDYGAPRDHGAPRSHGMP